MLLLPRRVGHLFGKTVITLLAVMLPIPATSFATTATSKSGNSSISDSVSFKKPQGLSTASKEAVPSSSPASVPVVELQPMPSILLPSSSIFTWGHVTKYSSVLYEEDVVVKGPIVLDVKYPQRENANSYTIVGIQAYDNDAELNSDYARGNLTLQVHPVMGGVGHNSTVLRFLLVTDHELHYKFVIHGVDL